MRLRLEGTDAGGAPQWLPLVGGMAAFVLAIVALLFWLIFGGSTGKQRGLVIVNLRTAEAVVTLDDGQSTRLKPGESRTLFAIKNDFPQTLRVTEANGAALFEQRVEYSALVNAEFRIAIAEGGIVFGNPSGGTSGRVSDGGALVINSSRAR